MAERGLIRQESRWKKGTELRGFFRRGWGGFDWDMKPDTHDLWGLVTLEPARRPNIFIRKRDERWLATLSDVHFSVPSNKT